MALITIHEPTGNVVEVHDDAVHRFETLEGTHFKCELVVQISGYSATIIVSCSITSTVSKNIKRFMDGA